MRLSKKENIALLRSVDDLSDSSSINIWSLRDRQGRASNTQLPHYSFFFFSPWPPAQCSVKMLFHP
jgi:hypothetical protein